MDYYRVVDTIGPEGVTLVLRRFVVVRETPEQRAAKERDEAVAAMVEAALSNRDREGANSTSGESEVIRESMAALYDMGWRKTEGE